MKYNHSLARAMQIVMLLTLLVLPVWASAATWNIDPDHSTAHFSIQHLMISQVRGMFPGVQGTVVFDGDKPKSFDITVNVNNISTGVVKRDTHLKSPDFFDVEKYPVMTFVSSHVEPVAKGYAVTGMLTIKDVSRKVTVIVNGFNREVPDPWQHTRRGGTAHFRLNRQDYHVSWNAPMGIHGVMVGNEVDIDVDMEAVKPQ